MPQTVAFQHVTFERYVRHTGRKGSGMTDAELLELLHDEGSTQALAAIYDCYSQPVYRYLYRLLGDAAQAEDLTSEVFLKLLNALSTSRAPRDRLDGWLYRVAHNLAIDWFRQQSKRFTVPLNEDLASDGLAASALVEQKQTHRRLRKAILKLTPSQQQVIVLRFGEEMPIAEVARVMGKSEGSIKLLQHRAVKRLGKVLERERNQDAIQTETRAVRVRTAPSYPGHDD